MKVYFDTGIFIDYLSRRGHVGSYLRSSEQRGRSVEQLASDAEDCFRKAYLQHTSITSSITLYEVENALYLALNREESGISDRQRFLITPARAVTIQVLTVVEFFSIDVIPLTKAIFERVVTQLELQKQGIKAGDALHVATALFINDDLIVAADRDILKLDQVFHNSQGFPIRCVDSDLGKELL